MSYVQKFPILKKETLTKYKLYSFNNKGRYFNFKNYHVLLILQLNKYEIQYI